MRFITNKQHGDQIRVQPEYKMTAECGTPIPNAEVNTPRRDAQEEILSKLWKNSCECLQLVDRYQQASSTRLQNGHCMTPSNILGHLLKASSTSSMNSSTAITALLAGQNGRASA